jgi:hypothetical protein
MNSKLDDSKIIKFFQDRIKNMMQRESPNRELSLNDLQDIFKKLKPYLNISDVAKDYIDRIIKDSLKKQIYNN